MINIKFKQIAATLVLAVFLGVQTAPIAYGATAQESSAKATQDAINYLRSSQKNDGSIGSSRDTDWSVVAVKATGQSPATFTKQGSGNLSLADASRNDFGEVTDFDGVVTKIERKIIAISASEGSLPETVNGENYAQKLLAQNVDNQIGSPLLLNDDYFGVIAVDASGKQELKKVAQDGLDYILEKQSSDGGFGYDTSGTSSSDMTAAAIIAIYAAEHSNLTSTKLASGKKAAIDYLLSSQRSDGGFGYDTYPSDADTTSWALMALNTIGNTTHCQASLARNWLVNNQNSDGSFGAYSRTYTTPDAITALAGNNWMLRPAANTVSTLSDCAAPPETTPPKPSSKPTNSKPKNSPEPSTVITSVSYTQPDISSPILTSENISSEQNPEPVQAQQIPEVKSASTPIADSTPSAKNDTSKVNWGLYGVGLLGLIGLGYFVVESLKAKGSK